MPLNIRNDEVNRLATTLAACMGTSQTEAVRRALEHELQRSAPAGTVQDRIAEIRQRVMARPATGLEADKEF